METMSRYRRTALTLAGFIGLAACTGLDGDDNGTAAAATGIQPVHVDSLFPIDEEVARFRSTVGRSAVELAAAAPSREALVERFMAALAARDVAALDAMALDAAEFIDLYYPHTRFTRPPYELAPQLAWFQLENYGYRGRNRALERFGGRVLPYRGHECAALDVEGENRVHGGCVVRIDDGGGGALAVPLFGTILERQGAFKFVSYANGL